MNFNKFDEFGNYIGDGESDSSETSEDEDEQQDFHGPTENSTEISVLPEDKEFYANPNDVYPSYTKVKNEDEDRQDYTEPIIQPIHHRVVASDMKKRPSTVYSTEFLISLFESGHRIRNVAVVGSIGHGKTELVDSLVRETHPNIIEQAVTNRDVTNQILGEGRRIDRLGWTDRLFLEKRRRMSILTEVMSMVEEDLEGRQYALSLIDTPGHPDFLDQVICGLSIADGVIFCVDSIEGLTNVGKRLLNQVIEFNLPMVLVITKIDRLILEVKLPPEEAHKKLRRIIEEVNTHLSQCQYPYRLSPELFNVAFTSAQFSLCFTCESIGLMYNRNVSVNYKFSEDFHLRMNTKKTDGKAFGARLWGDYRVDGRRIITSTSKELPHPFLIFVLEPLYKVFTHVLSYEPKEFSRLLHVPLTTSEEKLNTAPLLQIVLSRIFGTFASLVQIIGENIPSPCDKTLPESKSNIVAFAPKFVPSTNGENIYAIVRVFRGELKEGDQLFAIPESYRETQVDDPTVTIGPIALPHVRYDTLIPKAVQGMIVKIQYTNPKLTEISTLTDVLANPLPPLLLPLPLMKIAVEELDPNKHNEMIQSINSAILCYPGLKVNISINDEHTLLGTGEMYLDCVMYDIRNTFQSIEVKVSDPFVVFNETVENKSLTICEAKIDDNNSFGIIAEPLTNATLNGLETGHINSAKDLSKALQSLGWDQLEADNVLCFGPNPIMGPNILVDDFGNLANFSNMIKMTIQRSFVWATQQGPLCDEMMRGVKIRIADVNINDEKSLIPVKIIPAVRKAIFASFMAAKPRLMEPVNYVEIITPPVCISFIKTLIEKRRGKVLKDDVPIQGTPLAVLTCEIPLVDSFGFEVDVRSKTKGQAFALQFFNRWNLVPGDPLNTEIQLRPLEPSPDFALSYEFVLKTRRRKGLSEEVDMSKFFDDELLIEIAQLTRSEEDN
ncbi:hypothetical protein GPJ56_009709 [Histomonas meleagridis]|uniref:uncharacterized protein n=1 Tax=Histomonas meleagridis TaxID=135588 RepID=UPI0035596F30|nr:hypothetical protein GPJ56_009709 [Histomonas meleagridis]KAH0802271.1 hypothetical protein GO595_004884 [Histomonas meleagridis]